MRALGREKRELELRDERLLLPLDAAEREIARERRESELRHKRDDLSSVDITLDIREQIIGRLARDQDLDERERELARLLRSRLSADTINEAQESQRLQRFLRESEHGLRTEGILKEEEIRALQAGLADKSRITQLLADIELRRGVRAAESEDTLHEEVGLDTRAKHANSRDVDRAETQAGVVRIQAKAELEKLEGMARLKQQADDAEHRRRLEQASNERGFLLELAAKCGDPRLAAVLNPHLKPEVAAALFRGGEAERAELDAKLAELLQRQTQMAAADRDRIFDFAKHSMKTMADVAAATAARNVGGRRDARPKEKE